MAIYAALAGQTAAEVLAEFAGQGFGAFKPKLADLAVVGAWARSAARCAACMADPAEIDRVLAAGAERARDAGRADRGRGKKLVGFWAG